MRAGLIFSLLFLLPVFFLSSFPMYVNLGGGYRLETESFEPAGWLVETGISSEFGDEIIFDTVFNLGATSTSNPSPTNYLLFDVDLSIPLLGREENSWIKAGPFLSIEYGNFRFFDSTSTDWEETTWVGAFVMMNFGPWEFTVRGEYPIQMSTILEGESTDLNVADMFEMRIRFYLSSFFRNFVDKLFLEFLLSTRERKISVSFMEPF